MELRMMEKLNVKTSLLGFGCMRFPLNEDGTINETEAQQMLDMAITSGVNYIDTAYPYHGGVSEPFVGRVLGKYDRSSYYLATKLPVWKLKTLEDAKNIFEEQLARLHMDYVDFYLLHALNKERWELTKELGILDYLDELRAAGKIRYIGFSFHDDYEVFEEILTYRAWDFCQIQFNYMDTDEQAGQKGYELTEKLGVPLVIMEPVKGGSLAALPEDISHSFTEASPESTLSSWALRWVGTKPNVKVILSGMSNLEQVTDNLNTFGEFKPLDEKEQKLVENVAAGLRARVQNGCTACRYCMPCPAGVDIPGNFSMWNTYHIYQNERRALQGWKELGEAAQADKCIKCGKCEAVCPQKIAIRDDLDRVCGDIRNISQ